ncbi:unnamed protein product [Cuscuta epithymum]|uniref:Retrotransposon gag domain-containing protein n=1 Tax=Cuscuta epithymum TaxID=186058 RepID=A0AAV0D3K1_9ASTE|nr:unnamed protein product [Cuscuta epithymum]
MTRNNRQRDLSEQLSRGRSNRGQTTERSETLGTTGGEDGLTNLIPHEARRDPRLMRELAETMRRMADEQEANEEVYSANTIWTPISPIHRMQSLDETAESAGRRTPIHMRLGQNPSSHGAGGHTGASTPRYGWQDDHRGRTPDVPSEHQGTTITPAASNIGRRFHRHGAHITRRQTDAVAPRRNVALEAAPPVFPGRAAQEARLEAMERRMAEMDRRAEATPATPRFSLTSPFTPRVMNAEIPRDCRPPQGIVYNGTGDPKAHLISFEGNLSMLGASDEAICRLFFSTLRGPTQEWFGQLRPGSIDNYEQLSQQFMAQFAASTTPKKSFTSLTSVKQGKDEPLAQFLVRWRDEVLQVDDLDERLGVNMFTSALATGDLYRDLRRNPSTSYTEVLARAQKYASIEEEIRLRDGAPAAPSRKLADRLGPGGGPSPPNKKKKTDGGIVPWKAHPEASRIRPEEYHVPLAYPVSQIFDAIKDKGILREPQDKKALMGLDETAYSEYHQRVGHLTDNCKQLRMAIDELIRQGYLGEFTQLLKKNSPRQPNLRSRSWRRDDRREAEPKDVDYRSADKRPEGSLGPNGGKKKLEIKVIFGGAETGDTPAERKKFERSLYVGSISAPPLKGTRWRPSPLDRPTYRCHRPLTGMSW